MKSAELYEYLERHTRLLITRTFPDTSSPGNPNKDQGIDESKLLGGFERNLEKSEFYLSANDVARIFVSSHGDFTTLILGAIKLGLTEHFSDSTEDQVLHLMRSIDHAQRQQHRQRQQNWTHLFLHDLESANIDSYHLAYFRAMGLIVIEQTEEAVAIFNGLTLDENVPINLGAPSALLGCQQARSLGNPDDSLGALRVATETFSDILELKLMLALETQDLARLTTLLDTSPHFIFDVALADPATLGNLAENYLNSLTTAKASRPANSFPLLGFGTRAVIGKPEVKR